MRIFSEKEKKYLIRRENTITLEEFARKYRCDWHEVYDCYDEMIRSGEYIKIKKELEENGVNKSKNGEVRREEGEDESEHTVSLDSGAYRDNPRGFNDSRYFLPNDKWETD